MPIIEDAFHKKKTYLSENGKELGAMPASSGANKDGVVGIGRDVINLERPGQCVDLMYLLGSTHHKGVVERVGVPAQLGRIERHPNEIRHENGHKVSHSIGCRFRDREAVLWRQRDRPLAVLCVGTAIRGVPEIGKLRENIC